MKTRVFAVLFMLFTLAVQAQETFNNDSVIKLTAAKLSEDTIVTAVRTAPAASFDVTADRLVALKEAKVSDKVIAAMIERQNAGNSAIPPANAADRAAPAVVVPAMPNFTATQGGNATKLTPNMMAKQSFVASKANDFEQAMKEGVLGNIGSTAAQGIVQTIGRVPIVGFPMMGVGVQKVMSFIHKPKPVRGFFMSYISGLHSGNELVSGKDAEFFLPAMMLYGLTSSSVLPVVVSVQADQKENMRILSACQVEVMSSGKTGESNLKTLKVEQKDVPATVEKRQDGSMLVKVSALPAGEYALAMQDKDTGMLSQPIIDFTAK